MERFDSAHAGNAFDMIEPVDRGMNTIAQAVRKGHGPEENFSIDVIRAPASTQEGGCKVACGLEC